MKKSILSNSHFSVAMPLLLNCWFGCIFLLSTANSAFAEPKPTPKQGPKTPMERGEQSFQGGNFENAIFHWTTAAQVFAERGQTARQIIALIQLADAYQALGQYPASITILNRAGTLADNPDNPRQHAAVMNSLGATYVAMGEYEKATEILQKSVEKSRIIKATGLLAAILNNLGNLLTREKKFDQALEAYSESADFALSSGHQPLAVKASVNSALA